MPLKLKRNFIFLNTVSKCFFFWSSIYMWLYLLVFIFFSLIGVRLFIVCVCFCRNHLFITDCFEILNVCKTNWTLTHANTRIRSKSPYLWLNKWCMFSFSYIYRSIFSVNSDSSLISVFGYRSSWMSVKPIHHHTW